MFEKGLGGVLFLLMGLLCGSFSKAYAAGVSVLGGVSMTNTSTTNVSSRDPILRGTLGLDLDFGFAPLLALETGVFYQVRGFSTPRAQLSGSAIASSYESAEYLTLPVLVRFSMVPGVLKVGLGPYFSYAIGDFYSSSTSTAGNQTSRLRSFSDLNRNKFDLGVLASVRGSLSVAPLFDLLADLRFQYSFLNLTINPNLIQKYYDFIFLAGVRMRF